MRVPRACKVLEGKEIEEVRSRSSPKLTDKDTIVIADFTNTTGDPVFDDTLKQAVTIGLRQSPFLNILPDETLKQTLALMNRPLDAHLTRQVAVKSVNAPPAPR